MNCKKDYDVIVVGAGNAALTAALSAYEHGASVLVLEKAPKELRGGNSRFTAGIFRFAFNSVDDIKPLLLDIPESEWENVIIEPYTEEMYYDTIMKVTEGMADPILTKWLISNSYEIMRWMVNQGIKWEFATVLTTAFGGKRVYRGGTVLQAKGRGLGLMDMEFSIIERMGIEVRYKTTAVKLLNDSSGRVIGVKVKRPDGKLEDLMAGAIVLASGGFEANAEMRVKYLGGDWNLAKVRGVKFDTGELLESALSLGAQPYGHWADCHATPIDANAPDYGTLELTDMTNRLSYPFGIMVNIEGKRFMDEGEDLPAFTYAKAGKIILKQPKRIAFQIFDQKVLNLLEERYSTGKPIIANTIEELADKLHINKITLVKTVKEFNEAVIENVNFDPTKKDGKETLGINPPKSNWALKLDKPPFVAYKVTCGITFTFGGLKIDTNSRVLNWNDEPILGLYAAGEITGGFFYFNYSAGAGLMRGSVTGKAAGESAARGI